MLNEAPDLRTANSMLNRQSKRWLTTLGATGTKTHADMLTIAMRGELFKFLSHDHCQAALDRRWSDTGRAVLSPSTQFYLHQLGCFIHFILLVHVINARIPMCEWSWAEFFLWCWVLSLALKEARERWQTCFRRHLVYTAEDGAVKPNDRAGRLICLVIFMAAFCLRIASLPWVQATLPTHWMAWLTDRGTAHETEMRIESLYWGLMTISILPVGWRMTSFAVYTRVGAQVDIIVSLLFAKETVSFMLVLIGTVGLFTTAIGTLPSFAGHFNAYAGIQGDSVSSTWLGFGRPRLFDLGVLLSKALFQDSDEVSIHHKSRDEEASIAEVRSDCVCFLRASGPPSLGLAGLSSSSLLPQAKANSGSTIEHALVWVFLLVVQKLMLARQYTPAPSPASSPASQSLLECASE